MNIPSPTVSSALVVATIGELDDIVQRGVTEHPHCDCQGVNPAQILKELGCSPEVVYSQPMSDRHQVLVCRVPSQQLKLLSDMDPTILANLMQKRRQSRQLIVLARNEQLYEQLDAEAVRLAAIAVDRDECLFGRMEYARRADMH
jgi:hypothetical protein